MTIHVTLYIARDAVSADESYYAIVAIWHAKLVAAKGEATDDEQEASNG